MVHVHTEEYSVNSITVTVEWIHQIGAVYESWTSVLPPAPLQFIRSSSVQLVLEYNTLYNLSVIVAVPPCDADSETFIALNYGEGFFPRPFGNSHAPALCTYTTMHGGILCASNRGNSES